MEHEDNNLLQQSTLLDAQQKEEQQQHLNAEMTDVDVKYPDYSREYESQFDVEGELRSRHEVCRRRRHQEIDDDCDDNDEVDEEHDEDEDKDELKYLELQQNEKLQQQQEQHILEDCVVDENYQSEAAFGNFNLDNEKNLLQEEDNRDLLDNVRSNENMITSSDNVVVTPSNNNNMLLFGKELSNNTNGTMFDYNYQASAHTMNVPNEDKILHRADVEGYNNEDICQKMESDLSATASTTSNVTGSMEDNVPQIDVCIETLSLVDLPQQPDLGDEEEPSSLADNTTTNGTSSLSENIPNEIAADIGYTTTALEDKENMAIMDEQRNMSNSPDVELCQNSQSLLNPDAKEFVPNYLLANSPNRDNVSPDLQEDSRLPITPVIQVENAKFIGDSGFNKCMDYVIPAHLLDDEVIAGSPGKGQKGTEIIETIPQAMDEFIHEANTRPQEQEVFTIENTMNITPKARRILCSESGQGGKEFDENNVYVELELQTQHSTPGPNDEFKLSSSKISSPGMMINMSGSFLDHGPETCVDIENDSNMRSDDVMERSMYTSSNMEQSIEEVLNSVQPLPTEEELDSYDKENDEEANSSGSLTDMIIMGNKELLQVEEKELISNSPSTDEMPHNILNDLSYNNQLEHMDDQYQTNEMNNPCDGYNMFQLKEETVQTLNDIITPLSSEEKRLVEDTKESLLALNHVTELEQQMNALNLNVVSKLLYFLYIIKIKKGISSIAST